MINKDGGQFLDFMGGRSCYEGGHRAHARSPTRENPGGRKITHISSTCFENISNISRE